MRSSPRIAFQLYSVRSHPDSLPDILRRVAASGYEGVEFAHRFQREPPDGIAAALDETGLVPVAVHADLSDIEDALAGEGDLLERCATVGCDRLIVPHFDSTHFRTRESVRGLADRLTDAATSLDERGFELGLHNDRSWLCPLLPSAAETLIDALPTPEGTAGYIQEAGRRLRSRSTGSVPRNSPFGELVAGTDAAGIWFELEVAELYAGGVEPTEALSPLDDRVKLLHLRDVVPGPGIGEYEHAPLGDGVVDTERLLEAVSDVDVEWIVYEDELDTPPRRRSTPANGSSIGYARGSPRRTDRLATRDRRLPPPSRTDKRSITIPVVSLSEPVCSHRHRGFAATPSDRLRRPAPSSITDALVSRTETGHVA